jgi:dephospho-CoA kinase
MLIVALTGGICSGKSFVTKTFLKEGFPVVDADLISRKVVEPGTKGIRKLYDVFGSEYFTDFNCENLDRIKLGKHVFSNAKALDNLNYIMLPLIIEEAKLQFMKLWSNGHKLIIWDAPTIIENGRANKYRPLIVVHCSPEQQLERLMKRNFLSKEDALARINAQMPTKDKIKFADFLIDSSKDKDFSIKQTKDIIIKLKEMI